MKRCLRIIITATVPDRFLDRFILKHAQKIGLEGTAQLVPGARKQLRINVCGSGDGLDAFIDLLHEGTPGFDLEEIEIEPFLKDKDFRGVFRIIE